MLKKKTYKKLTTYFWNGVMTSLLTSTYLCACTHVRLFSHTLELFANGRPPLLPPSSFRNGRHDLDSTSFRYLEQKLMHSSIRYPLAIEASG